MIARYFRKDEFEIPSSENEQNSVERLWEKDLQRLIKVIKCVPSYEKINKVDRVDNEVCTTEGNTSVGTSIQLYGK